MLSSEGNASCTAVDALGNPSRLGRHRKERHVANCRPNAGNKPRRLPCRTPRPVGVGFIALLAGLLSVEEHNISRYLRALSDLRGADFDSDGALQTALSLARSTADRCDLFGVDRRGAGRRGAT